MKKTIFNNSIATLFAGLLTIFFIKILAHYGQEFILNNFLPQVPTGHFTPSPLGQPYVTFIIILKAISLFAPLAGGIAVGYDTKSKGWLYGALLGLIFVLISWDISLLSSVYRDYLFDENIPDVVVQERVSNFYSATIRNLPLAFILSLIGGKIGEYMQRRNKLQKTN